MEELGKVMVVFTEIQKTYGKTINLPASISGFRFAFEGKYTPEQVQYALKVHLQNSQEFPTPAHITAILNPPKPRVSYAEYIAALEWQKRKEVPFCELCGQRDNNPSNPLTADHLVPLAQGGVAEIATSSMTFTVNSVVTVSPSVAF